MLWSLTLSAAATTQVTVNVRTPMLEMECPYSVCAAQLAASSVSVTPAAAPAPRLCVARHMRRGAIAAAAAGTSSADRAQQQLLSVPPGFAVGYTRLPAVSRAPSAAAVAAADARAEQAAAAAAAGATGGGRLTWMRHARRTSALGAWRECVAAAGAGGSGGTLPPRKQAAVAVSRLEGRARRKSILAVIDMAPAEQGHAS